MHRTLLIVGLLLALGTVNTIAWRHAEHVATGRVVFLALAPRDPRSLLQGDYMALNYVLSSEVGLAIHRSPPTRQAVVSLSARRIGSFARLMSVFPPPCSRAPISISQDCPPRSISSQCAGP